MVMIDLDTHAAQTKIRKIENDLIKSDHYIL